MTATETPHEATFSVAGIATRITAAIQVLTARLSSRLAAGSRRSTPWYLLDDRLLQDIGVSPLDAEIARLHARMGASAMEEGTRLRGRDWRGAGRGADEKIWVSGRPQ